MKLQILVATCFVALILNSVCTRADDLVNWERQNFLKSPTNTTDITNLEHLARFGNVFAQTRMGQVYYLGEGVPVDFTKAFFWMQQAAASGGLVAQEQIAHAFYTGSGVDQNESVGHLIELKLANEGMPQAQHIVALDFLNSGIEEKEHYLFAEQPKTMLQANLIQAYKWIELARLNGQDVSTDRDHVLEEINAVSMNYAQKLVPEFKPRPPTPLRITAKGFEVQLIPWLEWQASNDLAYAQYDLGLRYLKGDGVGTNQTNAAFWIGKAAAQSYPPAVEFFKTNTPPQK